MSHISLYLLWQVGYISSKYTVRVTLSFNTHVDTHTHTHTHTYMDTRSGKIVDQDLVYWNT